jgi:hypothetical protein
MGMEKRRNKRYYYRKRRVGRRVVSEYAGSGYLAELEHTLQQVEHQERAERRAAIEALKAQLADPPELAQYLRLVRLLMEASLVAAGFRQHERGDWRLARE